MMHELFILLFINPNLYETILVKQYML